MLHSNTRLLSVLFLFFSWTAFLAYTMFAARYLLDSFSCVYLLSVLHLLVIFTRNCARICFSS